MKKILMIAAMMIAAVSVQAQNDDLKNEIGAYYGFGSASNVVSTVAGAFTFSSSDQTGFWGPVGIEYYRHVSPVVAIGAMASVAGCKYKEGIAKSTYYAVMPAVKFNYLRRNHFGLYSGLAAGVLFSHSTMNSTTSTGASENKTDNGTFFMFQITGIGAEFGGQRLRGFGELGFGERGVLCAGIRYKF